MPYRASRYNELSLFTFGFLNTTMGNQTTHDIFASYFGDKMGGWNQGTDGNSEQDSNDNTNTYTYAADMRERRLVSKHNLSLTGLYRPPQ